MPEVAAGKLQNQGITTLKLQHHFGRFGTELYDLCRGQDDRPVETQSTLNFDAHHPL